MRGIFFLSLGHYPQTAELDITCRKMVVRWNYVLFKFIGTGVGHNKRSGGV